VGRALRNHCFKPLGLQMGNPWLSVALSFWFQSSTLPNAGNALASDLRPRSRSHLQDTSFLTHLFLPPGSGILAFAPRVPSCSRQGRSSLAKWLVL
jgi:hypothetical protein